MDFFDGFEQFLTGDKMSPSSLLVMAGYTPVGSISTGAGRLPSSYGLYLLSSKVEREWTWSADTMTIGFACKQEGRGALLALKLDPDATMQDPHTVIYNDPDTGLVTVRNTDKAENVGYVTPLKNRWYYYEAVLRRSAGTVTMYVNGKEDVSFPLDPAIAAAANVIISLNPFDLVQFLPSVTEYSESAKLFDDLYIRDSGTLGPIQINGRMPSIDMSAEWNVSTETGAGPHWMQVGQRPPDVADRFIFTAENDKYDAFKSDAPLPENGRLIAQGVVALVRKATADPVSVIANIDSHTVNISNVGRNWEYRYTVMPVSGYNTDSIKAVTFGVRSVI